MKSELVVFVVDADPGVCDSVIASLWKKHVTVHCFSSAEQFLDGLDPAQAHSTTLVGDRWPRAGSSIARPGLALDRRRGFESESLARVLVESRRHSLN